MVWDESPYRGERLLIHLALADYANDEGICWPSQRTLAHKARCSENFVRLAVKQMVKEGWVEQMAAGNGRGNHARYLLKSPSTNGLSKKPHSPASETPFAESTLTTLLNHKEPSNLAEDFNRFWAVYPKKVAKGAAEKAFRKAMRTKDAPAVSELLDAVAVYAAGIKDLQYCAHPATWLNQHRWLDARAEKPTIVEVPAHIRGAQSFGSGFALTNATLEELREAVAHQETDYQQAAITAYLSRRKA